MKIKKNVSLRPYNQFGVDVKAKYFVTPKTVEEVKEIITDPKLKDEKIFVLGGGNNTLFVSDFNGLVIKLVIKGKEIVEEKESKVVVKVGAGEDWDKLVRWTVEQGWGGMENLIAIPGTVGGAVSQNIGAYGQQAADTVYQVETVNLKTGQVQVFANQDCRFEYHTSLFKQELKNKRVITHVWFKLTPYKANYKLNYNYASLKNRLKKQGTPPYDLHSIMQAVAAQRKGSLPDVDQYGTCGCFFMNPVVSQEKYQQLKKQMPDLVSYPVAGKNMVKIPAGKLVDKLNWKGRWKKNVGVSKKHALCLVTKRKASGQEILEFANRIKEDVFKNYGVDLEFEVNIVK